ncbi:STY0301 family protein [Pseudoduganella sp. OTU4001]|uniref:STY0301 family protein n=1 Tax=Pseudoduganella sp. OTU4001 TaxID=3043854 RepID=UPI00313E6350
MTTHRIIAALLGLMISLQAQSSSNLGCPPQISEPSVKLKDVDAGWMTFIAAPLYLHSVAVIDGPPERLGQLVGKHVATGRNAWTDTYDLRGPFPEGKWLQCSYGMLNEVVLAKRLDDRITACTIKGKKGDKAGQNVFSVECR